MSIDLKFWPPNGLFANNYFVTTIENETLKWPAHPQMLVDKKLNIEVTKDQQSYQTSSILPKISNLTKHPDNLLVGVSPLSCCPNNRFPVREEFLEWNPNLTLFAHSPDWLFYFVFSYVGQPNVPHSADDMWAWIVDVCNGM